MRRWHRRRFFVFDYEPEPTATKQGQGLGAVEILTLPACRIWGYESDSEFDEDHNSIDFAMKRGNIFGCWFSRHCPEGEPGMQTFKDLQEITEEEFEKALGKLKS